MGVNLAKGEQVRDIVSRFGQEIYGKEESIGEDKMGN